MGRITITFILLQTLFFPLTFAQDVLISKIEIKGLLSLSEEAIKTKLATKEGEFFSQNLLRDDIQRLYSLGYFSNVEVQTKQTLDGLRITFVVTENQRLGEIKIVGNFNLSRSEILEELKITKEKYLSPYTLSLDIIHLKELYQKEGYPFVEIETEKKYSGGWVDIYFLIDEGTEVYISEINFFGNRTYDKSTLLNFTQTKESGLFTSKHFNAETFQEDLILVRNFYRSEGFLDARVYLRDLFYSNDRTSVVVNVSVEEGPLYKVNNVSIEGHVLFTGQELKERFILEKGKAYKENDMLRDRKRIERLYGENGFLNVRIVPKPTYDLEKNVVDIHYEIEEGSTAYIRTIDIAGNVLTQDDVVRRELIVSPGERFNLGKIETAQQRLRRLRYFETIRLDLEDTDDDRWKDLSITVEDGRTGSLRFAAGITSDLGAVGEVSLTKRNFDITGVPTSFEEFFSGESFTGAGQNLDLFLQAGEELLRFRIGFTEPYFLGYNLLLGTEIFRTARVRESWREQRTGFELSLGKRLARDTTVRLSYRIENVEVDDIDDDAAPDVFDVEGNNLLSSAKLSFTIDTRDDFILPTRGYILGYTQELFGLGGDHEFFRSNFRFAWFQTVYTEEDKDKHVVSIGGRLGFSGGLSDDDDVPIFERFFAGGSSSIRGYEFRTVGPKFDGEDPLGGEFLAIGTVEYNFPIYEDVMRMVLFTDVGSVSESVKLELFETLRVSTGFGFRLKVPAFGPRPFAFDFGFSLQDEEDDDTRVFSFSFGKQF